MGLADSPHIQTRVLLTNCDDLPLVLNERRGFFCIRGSDLDRLEPDDFRTIETWLADAAYKAPKKRPQPHQDDALKAVLPALETNDRVSAIMACGTGKTLVALWVAERRHASRVLVLVPSLALVRQTLHEWLHETSLPSLAYLCVCSDPTVKEGLDSISAPQSDLDFQVSTDPASVRGFLDVAFTGTKVVFSTYQSARVVAAALKPGEVFDLGVFDEAHKTAGREGRNYAFALDDKNLPIGKRLFLTATPRHYNALKHDREGDAQLVFSMDSLQVYGPQAFRLSFAEAATRKPPIICGYKVVISVITSDMITNDLLRRGEVVVDGDAVRARQVANQIALRDAIEKHGVSKVFTFHSTVASASSFVTVGGEGLHAHLPSFETFHVNAKMPTGSRERKMRDFKTSARAVMSNARCLTEGVDVPAVDMVAFLSPRRSRVDIVQATGRAMRCSPGKTTGYVLVPLYVEVFAGEPVEAAIQRSKFDEVWDVLQAMLEQDVVLAEIIRQLREQRGRTGGFDDSRFREKVEVLGPEILLDRLRTAITTTCIDTLAPSWEERFGELKAFKDRFGHCNVEHQWPENPKLGHWVANQRKSFTEGRLSEDRVKRMNEIGFTWNPADAFWEDCFAALKHYAGVHGHCAVPQKHLSPCGVRLGSWVNTQRQARRKGMLSATRVGRLDELGFVWQPKVAHLQAMLAALRDFKRSTGHCCVPDRWPDNPELATWVSTLRQRKSRGELGQSLELELTAEGFVWDAREAAWEASFRALIDYRSQTGSFAVPRGWPPNPKLAAWVLRQRRLRKTSRLSVERIARLDAHGFPWFPHDVAWEDHFARFLDRQKSQGARSEKWESHQRTGRKAGTLSAERIRRLSEASFEWSVKKGPKGPRQVRTTKEPNERQRIESSRSPEALRAATSQYGRDKRVNAQRCRNAEGSSADLQAA